MNDSTPKYDLFLSYNSQDREVVTEIRTQLQQLSDSLKTFIDREDLTLGQRWFEELQSALLNCRAVAVFYGEHGLGRWQNLEMMLALDLQAVANSEQAVLVIPVILPGADLEKAPRFLLLNNFLDFRSGPNEAGLQRLIQTVLGQSVALDALPANHELRNPYRGLNVFQEEDASLFFGREQVAEQLLEKVKQEKLVALVGNSGSGKSSVVRAGLIPLLRKQHIPDQTWEVLICIPALNNVNPFHNLAAVFLESWDYSSADIVNGRPQTERTFRTELSLVDAIDQTLEHSQKDNKLKAHKLLLVIDQFEELIKFDINERSAADNQTDDNGTSKRRNDFESFIELLLNAIEADHCTVLLTIRGDYFGSVTERHPKLGELIGNGTVPLCRMENEQLNQIIEQPAKLAGGQFEPGLVERIRSDVRQQPGNLALLEFALTQLWNYREKNLLTHAAYDEQVGKLEGAIRTKADEVLQSKAVSNKKLALSALARLVHVSPNESGEGDTRQRIRLTEFTSEERNNLEPFIKARLLVASGSGDNESTTEQQTATLEVAHEALIKHWPKLQQELKGKRELLLWRQSVQGQYQEWQQLQQSSPQNRDIKKFVLEGYPLQQGLKWLEIQPKSSIGNDDQFIKFIKLSDRVWRQRQRRYLGLTGATIVVFLLMITSFIWVEGRGASLYLLPKIFKTRVQYQLNQYQLVERLDWVPEMEELTGGEFMMGSASKYFPDDEKPQHKVTIKPFWIGIKEITFAEYKPFVDDVDQNLYACNQIRIDVKKRRLGNLPAFNVSWIAAQCYVNWLSLVTGGSFRLPTESEWEYAARAGTTSDYYWGNDSNKAADYAWSDENSNHYSHSVAQKQPNAFGLYDMSGNVWEWTADCWHDNYEGAPVDGSAWLARNAGNCERRVIRGGSWIYNSQYLRSADRHRDRLNEADINFGFRVARDL